MFEVGKVYETVEGKPAKVLWIQSDICTRLGNYNQKFKLMYVLHGAYTALEGVRVHFFETGIPIELDAAYNVRDLTHLTLTKNLYNKEFKN